MVISASGYISGVIDEASKDGTWLINGEKFS
jgi:hypothetical protein